MKKIISVLLALIMVFSIASFAVVSVYAEDTQENNVSYYVSTVDNATGAVSGYIPFSYACDYCGETHEGFFGVLIAMFHTVLSAVKLAVTAVQR